MLKTQNPLKNGFSSGNPCDLLGNTREKEPDLGISSFD